MRGKLIGYFRRGIRWREQIATPHVDRIGQLDCCSLAGFDAVERVRIDVDFLDGDGRSERPTTTLSPRANAPDDMKPA